jgi:plastocyanin
MSKNQRYTAMAACVLLAACSGGGGSSPAEPPSSTTPSPTSPKSVMVTISDFQFTPKNITINPGDTVVWTQTSNDSAHTVTASDGSFDSGAIFTSVGKTFSHTFSTGGVTVNYFCKAHYTCCGMAGAVQVGTNAPPVNPGY